LNDTRSGRPLTTRNSEGFGELVRNRRMAPKLMDDQLQINRKWFSQFLHEDLQEVCP